MKISNKYITSLIALFGFASSALADEYHFKNFLIGDRASGMAGAYIAVADDASGSWYNPAGTAFAQSDSISGSGNGFNKSTTTYKGAIGVYDWERTSETFLPNFFGMLNTYGDVVLSFSFVVPDSTIEHQDQIFLNPNSLLKVYAISLQREDRTNLFGPSLAYRFSDNFSMGATFYYHNRVFRAQQNQYLLRTDDTTDVNFSSTRIEEHGFLPKFGFQWNLLDSLSIGGTYSTLTVLSKTTDIDYVNKISGESEASLVTYEDTAVSNGYSQAGLGVAFYPSPFLLVSTDVDYYLVDGDNLENVLNYSVGFEYYLNTDNAIRMGYYTNNDSRIAPSAATTAPQEKIDKSGVSLGYSSFTRTSSFTISAIYSQGSGESQIFSGSSATREVESNTITLIFAGSYIN